MVKVPGQLVFVTIAFLLDEHHCCGLPAAEPDPMIVCVPERAHVKTESVFDYLPAIEPTRHGGLLRLGRSLASYGWCSRPSSNVNSSGSQRAVDQLCSQVRHTVDSRPVRASSFTTSRNSPQCQQRMNIDDEQRFF